MQPCEKAARVVLAQSALPVRPPGTQTSAGAGGNKTVTWVKKMLPEVTNVLLTISVLDQPGPPPLCFFSTQMAIQRYFHSLGAEVTKILPQVNFGT